MTGYAALLRGIMPSNPAMRNERLRAVFEELGLERVASVLASGNIVFHAPAQDTAALEEHIQHALHERLGIPGGTLVRTGEELGTLLDSDPFPGLTHGRGSYLTVVFLKHRPAAPVVLPEDPDPLTRVVGYDPVTRAFLAVVDNSDPGTTPDFMAWVGRTYGRDVTVRTWLTVQRVARKLEA
ncbi:DUF1697 domain-containing protein [Georgenia satyanarayanai]|uniref:DUF1697 domain-containing protein n=1 Tax=Georgenia satyanarayanai TaxID=860221 RepID=UPI001264CA52|nr:DUF1697 domain-containing protein [Georgenia satyanarayanai]